LQLSFVDCKFRWLIKCWWFLAAMARHRLDPKFVPLFFGPAFSTFWLYPKYCPPFSSPAFSDYCSFLVLPFSVLHFQSIPKKPWFTDDEIQLSNDSDAMQSGWMHWISIRPTYSYSCTYLLTYTVGSGRTKPAIYSKRLKIERKLLLTIFCPVLQLHWLIIVSLHWLLRDPTIIVTCPCSPRTYATLKQIRSSSTAYIKSYTGFRLPPKCMTLNDLWAGSRSLIP